MTTTTISSETTGTINKLVETLHDGEKGFEHAATGVQDAVLKAELLQYSGQRAEFAGELSEALAGSGEQAAGGGTVAGALHRGWINIKEVVTKSDRYAILAECERGEDVAVAAYRKASSASLPTQLANLVSTQHQAIQRVHDRIKALRDAAKKA